ncbi:hypothetical protein [Arthrobacter sp. H14-L1]|uniref:hypothetical protein n=1 Tax=Arthrobacter sp. H14-L1 TaxID=2996697 RepID=UPI002270CF48|nr:hypothetical protein [Arthrobacter sp. H14-L1]MCY0906202.1 hypothetical protein [Arthrobacter sp. H14-L1]
MSNSKPKNDWETLEIFEALAAEYFAAKAALNFPSLREVIAQEKDPRTYWLQQMQGMMLRKFFADNDNVQLRAVAQALRGCAVPSAIGDVDKVAGCIEWQFEQAEADETVSFKKLLSEGGQDAFKDLIYGRLLHAEAPRFRRTQLMQPHARAVALFIGTADVQKTLQLAAHYVALCRENGWIAAPPE